MAEASHCHGDRPELLCWHRPHRPGHDPLWTQTFAPPVDRPHPHPTTDISACFLTVKYAVARLEPVNQKKQKKEL